MRKAPKVPRETLAQAIIVTAEVMGHELSVRAAEAMARALTEYPPAAVATALRRCQRELQGRLTLAAILARIDDGRPGPEQAWAICAQARDEGVTVVWTDEMSDAWGVARKLEDDVAARMAFKEAYAALVTEARAERRPTRWLVSLGHDAERRSGPILDAVEAGRLLPATAREYVHPGLPDFGAANARLCRIEGREPELPADASPPPPELRKLIAGIGGRP